MYKVKMEKGLAEYSDARGIRERVFMEEQGFSEEFDDIDKAAVHVVLYQGEVPAATGRIYQDQKDAKRYYVGRIAVIPECRGLKLGDRVVRELEQYAKEQGAERFALSAQVRVRGFYEKLGYQAVGEPYMDEHCPHILMERRA